MALLRRRRHVHEHPVTVFWQWWADDGERATTAAVGTGEFGDLASVISTKTAAIHPDLVWELSAGTVSRHALVVAAGGVAELRPLAERWRRAAPPSSPTWEYHAARQADPDAARNRLDFGGATLALDEIRVGLEVDEDRDRVDVRVFHPAFATMAGSGPGQVTFLVLDWLLGEDDVERWVGGVEAVTTRPADAHEPAELRRVVDGLRQHDRSDEWALLEGQTDDGGRLIVMVRRFLRWIDRPLLDQHHAVTLGFERVRADGLPESDALDDLRGIEDGLERAVAGRGELIAVATAAGRRTWHLYTDSEDQNGAEAVTRFAAARGATHVAAADPAWHAVRHFQ